MTTEREPRGQGDHLRESWLLGNIRPPFCDSRLRGGEMRGCRYCWQDTCKWDDNHRELLTTAYGVAEESPTVPTGRHRATLRRQHPLFSLLRRTRKSSDDER